VSVNLKCVSRKKLAAVGASQLPRGDYWYDARSGLAGKIGGPYLRQVAPRLPLPGPVPLNASGQRRGIVINGRAVHPREHQLLVRAYGQIRPGRYWLDANGNAGTEGSSVPLVNLKGPRGRGGDGVYRTNDGRGNFGLVSKGCTAFHTRRGASVYLGCD